MDLLKALCDEVDDVVCGDVEVVPAVSELVRFEQCGDGNPRGVQFAGQLLDSIEPLLVVTVTAQHLVDGPVEWVDVEWDGVLASIFGAVVPVVEW